MCLAAAYQGQSSHEPMMRDIARISIDGGTIEIETLFGERKVLQGSIGLVDFMDSKVIIEPLA